MRLEKHTGFVVYGFPLGEADQIVSCFTSEGNLVKFIAKGSRKIKSRFAASVQLFNLAEFVLYKSKGLPYLRQAAIIDSFAPVRRDWQKSGAAFAVAELCRLLIGEEAGEQAVFRHVLAYMLHLRDRDYVPLTFDAFRWQLAAALGYGMQTECCAICRQAARSGCMDWSQGGLVCPRCRSRTGGVGVDVRHLALLRTLSRCSFAESDKLVVNGNLQRHCARLVDDLIFWLTEGKTKAQAFRKLFEELRCRSE